MAEPTWTAIARCGTCKRELNRAEGVPESKKTRTGLFAAFVALCPTREHNTFSDLNWNFEIEWVAEVASA